jgi:hypothetical protein
MHIRVECSCGQAYAFDVEPVNNLMPCPVVCPACGVDGTQLANQFIASASGVPQIPVPPPVPAASGLRINRQPSAAPVPAAAGGPAPPVPPVPAYTRTYQPPQPPQEDRQSILRGILGGVVGGGVAMAGWYFLTMSSGREFGIAAWFVGVITGLSVKIFARDGSSALAYIAAVCAGIAILGGDFLVTNAIVNKFAGIQVTVYDEMVKEATEGVKLQTDAEIKAWLQANDDSGDQVTSEDIDNFRKVRQPKMQDLLNGKPSKADFMHNTNMTSFAMKFTLFKESLSLFTLLWVFFGVGSAWRIASK